MSRSAGIGDPDGEPFDHPQRDPEATAIDTLRVSTRSNPNSVAGAIAGVVRDAGEASVQVVGAGALNQAIKAVAIARSYLEPSGVDLVCVPSFADVDIDGDSRTAIRLAIADRSSGQGSDPPDSVAIPLTME